MVRVIRAPEDTSAGFVFHKQKTPLFLSEAGERMLKPKDLENKGLTRQAEHIIMYRWNAFSCGYFSDRWGFDEEYPDFLKGHVDEEEWRDIIPRATNYELTGTCITRKLVWVPFFLCCFFGAICEGAAYSNDRMPAPGVVFAVWVLVGFLVSAIYLVVMREIVKGDLSRIASLCFIISNRFRQEQRGIILAVKPSSPKAPHLHALAVQYHVPEANIAVHTFNPEDAFGRADLHTVQVEEWPGHSRLVVSDRFHPARDLGVRQGGAPVFEYGRGARYIAPPEERKARRAVDEDEEGEVREQAAAPAPEEEQPFGWCDCQLTFQTAPSAPARSAPGAAALPLRASAVVVFNGATFVPCPVCKRMRGRPMAADSERAAEQGRWAGYKSTLSTGALAHRAETAMEAAKVSIAQHRGY